MKENEAHTGTKEQMQCRFVKDTKRTAGQRWTTGARPLLHNMHCTVQSKQHMYQSSALVSRERGSIKEETAYDEECGGSENGIGESEKKQNVIDRPSETQEQKLASPQSRSKGGKRALPDIPDVAQRF